MIESKLQNAVASALNNLYGLNIEADSVVLQKTKKEFSGDYTVVVFPYVKQARKAPEALANELGNAVAQNLHEIKDFNVIKNQVFRVNTIISSYKDNK